MGNHLACLLSVEQTPSRNDVQQPSQEVKMT